MGSGSFDPLATASGIAITGGYIYNALAGGNIDAVENEGKSLDVCLSHTAPGGDFHYHYWSNCLKKGKGYFSDSQPPPECLSTDNCLADPADFTMNKSWNNQPLAYTAENWDDVIGLAKDGHVIIGPYKKDGTPWGCDRDICNGNFIDGQYVYVGSDKFPYVVGCWGPGPDPKYAPTCTSSGCSARSDTGGSTSGGTDGTVTQGGDGDENDFAFSKLFASITLFTAAMSTLCF